MWLLFIASMLVGVLFVVGVIRYDLKRCGEVTLGGFLVYVVMGSIPVLNAYLLLCLISDYGMYSSVFGRVLFERKEK